MAAVEVSLNMSIKYVSYKSGVAPFKDSCSNLNNSDTDKAQLLTATDFVQDDGKLPPFSEDENDSLPKVSSIFFNPGNVFKILKKLKSNGSGGA